MRRSVARRLKALPAPARLTAHALAIAGSAPSNDLVAAMTGLTQEQIDEGLRDLSAIELITGQPPRLRHPVIRTAIDQSITGISRAQMHRAAAEFLHRVGAPADEVVLHVLSAPSPLPEWALAELEVGSRRAMAEGAPYVALQRIIRAYEEARAQGLGVDAVRLELGTVEQRLGLPGAVEHLQAAATSERDVVSAEALRALLALGEGLIDLIDRAERVAAQLMTSDEGALATDLRASAYVACRQSPRLTDRRLTLLTTLGTEQEALSALSITAFERANLGATRDEVSDRLALLRRIGPLQRLEEIEQPMIFWAVEAALGVDVTEGMHAFLDSAELLARRSGSRLAAAFASFLAANWSLAMGSTESAEVRGLEALEHFTAFGATGIGSVAAATVAAALIRRDRLSEAEELLSGHTNEHLADNFEGLLVLLRRGELRLAQGRGLEAVADLRLLQELVEAIGVAALMPTVTAARSWRGRWRSPGTSMTPRRWPVRRSPTLRPVPCPARRRPPGSPSPQASRDLSGSRRCGRPSIRPIAGSRAGLPPRCASSSGAPYDRPVSAWRRASCSSPVSILPPATMTTRSPRRSTRS